MNQDKDPELIRQKTRFMKAQADMKEFKLKILKGEYVKVSDVEKNYAKIIIGAKVKLLAMPDILAPNICNKSILEVCNILREYIDGVLNEFADNSIV